jgi:hypothetical protein
MFPRDKGGRGSGSPAGRERDEPDVHVLQLRASIKFSVLIHNTC